MNRIKAAFENKALITYLTGGDPSVEVTEKLIVEMAAAGADIVEIGIPFSDPSAEGPVIGAAHQRALKGGTTIDALLEMVARVRQKTDIALVFMSYLNPIFVYGKERFLARCVQVGIDGIIVPDLPHEERDELKPECERAGVVLIPLIAPTSKDRIEKIAMESSGFLYCVSSLGVTGMRKAIDTDIESMIKEVRKVSNTPSAVGFGVSGKEQARQMVDIADGVVIGSAIVDIIGRQGANSISGVREFVAGIKEAIATYPSSHR